MEKIWKVSNTWQILWIHGSLVFVPLLLPVIALLWRCCSNRGHHLCVQLLRAKITEVTEKKDGNQLYIWPLIRHLGNPHPRLQYQVPLGILSRPGSIKSASRINHVWGRRPQGHVLLSFKASGVWPLEQVRLLEIIFLNCVREGACESSPPGYTCRRHS